MSEPTYTYSVLVTDPTEADNQPEASFWSLDEAKEALGTMQGIVFRNVLGESGPGENVYHQ